MNTSNNNTNHSNKTPNKNGKKFKMNEKTLTTLLYVGAAVLVVVILGISIFAFASRKNTPPTPQSSTAITTPAETSSLAPVTQQTPVTTAPTTNKVANIDKPTASTPSYVNPVEGTVLKNHDSEALVYSVTMNDYRAHLGIDVEAPVGTPVYSMADGTIKSVYQDYMMGTCIEIEHKNGIVSCYKNLGEVLPDGIKEGATVKLGQLIAGVGETAIIEQCDEAHLHFEVMKNGEQVNPLDYISYGKDTESLKK